jgi:dTDP-4-amino-4,6-dideoxygalactose transaminase
MAVALFDTGAPLRPLRPQIDAAIARVVDSGRFILGPEVSAFEAQFAAYCGTRHAIGVANGTEALTIALRAMGVGEGDDVVVPSFTFYASAEAIPPTGARPVFCDVDPESGCVTADTVRAALTPATKAVIAVHLFGNVAPVAEIEALGVPVLEDAAQAAGSLAADGRPGALGRAATFSFFPSKNLGAFGDGGAITTDDDEVAEQARTLRFHGSRDKVAYDLVGYNSRLDELQAAVLRVLLPHLDGWADGRRAAAAHYADAGLGELVTIPVATRGSSPAWHLYVVRSERADELAAGLASAGVEARAYYRTPVHRQPAMAPFASGSELPATDELARTHLAIPMSPVLSAEQAAEVTAAARAVLARGAPTRPPPARRGRR